MASYGEPITIQYTAWDAINNQPKISDAGNHTLRWTKDGTTAGTTNGPTEVDPVNAPGEYKVLLTAGECQCWLGKLAGKSSSSGVYIIGQPVSFERLPTAALGASGGLPLAGAGGKVAATLAIGDVSGGNLPAIVNAYGSGLDPAANVLNATAASYNAANSIGNKINSAGAGSDPWGIALPGSYTAGQAGYILGTNLNAAVSSRMASGNVTVGGYAANQDPATLVLNATAASYNAANSIGNKINAAASAGDPWTTSLPGSYTAGQAGYIVGTNLNAAVSTRMASGPVTLAAATHTGAVIPSVTTVGSVTAGVTVATNNDKTGYRLDLAQPLTAARLLNAVGDTSLTLNDAMHCAVAILAGTQNITGTQYTLRTPSTGTVLRTYTLNSATTPSDRQ
jgi:hypothetical protein